MLKNIQLYKILIIMVLNQKLLEKLTDNLLKINLHYNENY